MNKSFLILISIFLLSACSSIQDPASLTLEEQKELLKGKKATHRELGKEITQLEAMILAKDSSFNEEKKQLVTLRKAQSSKFETYAEIQGAVRADNSVKPSSQVGGRLIRLFVKEGDNIRQGQLLGITDTSQIVKGIEELQTNLTLARDIFNRQSNLWEKKIGSEIQYLQAKNQVETLEKKLASLEDQKSKTRIYAPIAGVVDRVLIEQGEMAGPGSPIVMVINLSKLKVVADVSEKYIKAIRKGDMVRVTIPALDLEQKARVSLIGSTLNPGNRTFSVEVVIYNREGFIKPNMLATMFILDYETDNAIIIPSAMVQQDVSGKDFLFVAENQNGELRARKVVVETGVSYLGNTEILSGLKENELLIVKGSREVTNGELLDDVTEEEKANSEKSGTSELTTLK